MIRESLLDSSVFDQFAANPHFYVPLSFNLNPVTQSAQVNEVATTFRNMYFGGQHPHAGIRYNYTVYNTDHQFSFFVDRAVRYHARRQTQPIFYYKFRYDGSLNMMKRLIGLASVSSLRMRLFELTVEFLLLRLIVCDSIAAVVKQCFCSKFMSLMNSIKFLYAFNF